MKIKLTILFILVFALAVSGQTKKPAKNYVELVVNDERATSELLPMPLVMSPNLSGAEIGIKYFGAESESDISFILMTFWRNILTDTRGNFFAIARN